MYSKSLSNEENLGPVNNNPRTWVPYMSTRDCSQGFCSYYCPQWCYIILPPPPPFDFPDDDDTSPNFSPLVIAIIAILASAFLLVSYYAIISKYCGNRNIVSRRREHNNNEDDSELEEGDHEAWNVNAVGLDEALIKSITVLKYKKGDGLMTQGTECSVCLSEFQDDESLRLLPKCSHAFHVMCIDTWLKSHSNCPLCRANIISVNGSPPPLPPPIMETPQENETTQLFLQENDIETQPEQEESRVPETEHVNQEVRRSVSMDYTSQSRLSIADVLRIDHEDEDYQLERDVGTSKQDINSSEEMSSRCGIRNYNILLCVASPMVMKRSLSTGTGRFLFTKRERGQNMVIPLSNV